MNKLTKSLLRLAAAMGIVLATTASAHASPLYLKTANADDQAIELGDISKITFGDDKVVVSLVSGTTVEVPSSSFVALSTTSSGMTSVVDLTAADNGSVEVYGINGVLVGRGTDAVKNLKSGVYVVKSESKTVKIVVP